MKSAILATALTGLALSFAAAPARAGDFDRGFKTELGRIAAHEVVAAAHVALLFPPPFFRPPFPPPPVVVVTHRHAHEVGCAHWAPPRHATHYGRPGGFRGRDVHPAPRFHGGGRGRR